MKWTIVIFLYIVSIHCAMGQKQISVIKTSNSPINIASEKIQKSFTPPPAFNQLKSASEKKCEIQVVFVDFPEEAKTAFLYATSIWETSISSQVPIKILAKWESVESGIVAKSKPSSHYRSFDQALIKDVYYPVALAEKLSGKNLNNAEPEIICSFNKSTSWYLGTDGNTPQTQYDFVTAVLHEITHGLGFSGFLSDKNGNGFLNNGNNLPSIYDYYIYNTLNQQISNNTIFNSPSIQLHNQLTSEKLKFHYPENTVKSANDPNWIYAPTTWRNGASIYHLNQTFDNENGLMSAYAYKGKAIHNPGEKTMQVLSDIGWKSVSFNFTELKDIEEPIAKLPVSIDILADIDIKTESIKLVYSTNYFSTSDSISLVYDAVAKTYKTEIPLNYAEGCLQYYFKLSSANNVRFTYPGLAPEKRFGLRVGPDYFPPTMKHNPANLVSNTLKSFNVSAIAEDNVGINEVKVEYKIDGISQEPIVLANQAESLFNGKVVLPSNISKNSKVEYRLVAEDIARNKNKKMLPANGYYSVNVFESEEPISAYSSNFNTNNCDFVSSDFTISTQPGFKNGMLHTQNPYQTSNFEDEKYNLIAQLKYPIVIQEGGLMTFDEIVLVEPGENGTNYNDPFFWDYVIVEASKDNGNNWLPVTSGYDAQDDENWLSEFDNHIVNNTSTSSGKEELFKTHTINLTENTGLKHGDVVIFRFRLSSDNSINGWGWAIDNLDIQKLYTDVDETFAEKNISVYPNPCSNHLYVDCTDVLNTESVEITVTDLMGKTAYNETWVNTQYNPKKQIDLSNMQPGIYLVNIVDESYKITTQKIIKN